MGQVDDGKNRPTETEAEAEAQTDTDERHSRIEESKVSEVETGECRDLDRYCADSLGSGTGVAGCWNDLWLMMPDCGSAKMLVDFLKEGRHLWMEAVLGESSCWLELDEAVLSSCDLGESDLDPGLFVTETLVRKLDQVD